MIVFLIIYAIGFVLMVYELGLPLRGSFRSVVLWALAVGLWPLTLFVAWFIDNRHR